MFSVLEIQVPVEL